MANPDGSQTTDPSSIEQIVTQVATQLAAQYGVDATKLVQIALAVMQQESGGDPTNVGDQGTSFGLFQLHRGGELGNLTEQQAFDPATNARVAITVMAQVLKANPTASDGDIAAMAQRPLDPTGYAASVNSIISGGGAPGAQDGATAAAGAGAQGGPPPLSDPAALDQYVRQNFGSDAWLLNIPDVKAVLEKAVAAGDDAGQIQAALMQTNWWKTTSQSMQAFDALQANTPAELNFNIAGSQAARQLADVMATAASEGVRIDTATGQQFALNVMRYGWDANQLKAAIADTITYGPKGGNAMSVVDQLKTTAGQYLMNPSDQVLQSWAQNIAAGTQTMDQFTAYLRQNASLKWTGMASQINQGYTPNQIVDNMRQEAAKTLEVDPSSIDFVNNPTYSKILDYSPPDTRTGVHRVMTLSEMDQYLKASPQYATTQGARDQVGQLANTIITEFGKAVM